MKTLTGITATEPTLTALAVALGLGLLIGLLLGAALHFLLSRRRRVQLERENAALAVQIKSAEEIDLGREQALDQAESRLAATMARLSQESLSRNSENFLRLAQQTLGQHQEKARSELSEREKAVEQLVKPIREALDKTREQINEIEKTRRESFGSIKTAIETMNAGQATLRSETQNLVKALRKPEVRGQWGEMTLRRIVELAGMVEHCDFTEQAHTATDEGAIRPDMIVRLAEERQLVIDVKTPLDAYLDAVEAGDDSTRQQAALARHERNLREHIQKLASKRYWSQFETSPEFVILFVPGDQFLSAALTVNPNLIDEGLRQQVILATPSSLMALLKSAAYGWRQLALAENASQIRDLAEDLYNRLNVFTTHLVRMGKSLAGSVEAYNSAVGSLERKVLPGAKKFTELGVQPKNELPDTPTIEAMPRSVEDRSQPDKIEDKSAKH